MDVNIVMLGTAGSSPTKERSMPSIAIKYEGDLILFDCGESAQLQMLRYGVNFSKLKAIFISHAHGDHVIGVAGLVRTLGMNRRTEPLKIFIPKGYESVIKMLLSFDRALLEYSIEVIGVGSSGVVYKGNGYSIKSFKLKHSIPAYGYVFKEDDRRRFIVSKTAKLGIKGEMHSSIQKNGSLVIGKKTVKLEDVTSLVKGKKIAYAADTRPSSDTVKAAGDADLLIHESSYAEEDVELAKERMHSTAFEAATVAKKAKVKRLVLTHISARYSNVKKLEDDAKKAFKESRVASDGDNIIV